MARKLGLGCTRIGRHDRGRCLPSVSRSKVLWSMLVLKVTDRITAARPVLRSLPAILPVVETCGKAGDYLSFGNHHYLITIGIRTHYPRRYHIWSGMSIAKAGRIVLGDVSWVRVVKSSFTGIIVITTPARAFIFLSRAHLGMFETIFVICSNLIDLPQAVQPYSHIGGFRTRLVL